MQKKKHLHLSTVQDLRDEATEQLLIKSMYLYYFFSPVFDPGGDRPWRPGGGRPCGPGRGQRSAMQPPNS